MSNKIIRELFQSFVFERKKHTYIMEKNPFSFGDGGGPKQNVLIILIATSIGIYNNQKK